MLNLAVNARDAMPGGGRLTIQISRSTLEELGPAACPGRAAGPCVVLAVSDTGIGMDAATRAHIFEPFFTTKEHGTGLGLATVFGIVRQSGGTIVVCSEPGKGSTFKVVLPEFQTAPESPVQPEPTLSELRGTEAILLVEDDAAVRRVARAMLETSGYTVLEALSAEEALKAATRHPDIRLLLIDVVMPRVNGPQLAARIQEVRPGVAVLFMSGYAPGAAVLRGILSAGAAFVQKPLTPLSLLAKVRAALRPPA